MKLLGNVPVTGRYKHRPPILRRAVQIASPSGLLRLDTFYNGLLPYARESAFSQSIGLSNYKREEIYMNHRLRVRLVLFTLLIACLTVTSLLSLPSSAEAACATSGCGSWMWNGCCNGNKQYQYRQCCVGTSCCFQYRCLTNVLCAV